MNSEQTSRLIGYRVDYRTDLYSLGVTFFYMLSGRFPFESQDLLELIHAHTTVLLNHTHFTVFSIYGHQQQPPSVRTFVSDVSVPLAAIVAKLIAKVPKDRYQVIYP